MADGAETIESLLGAARAAEKAKDWAVQLDLLERCLRTAPDHNQAVAWRRAAAATLNRLGRFAEAEAILRRLIQEHGGTPVDLATFAVAAQRGKHWGDAVRRWADCIARFPQHPAARDWRSSLGAALLELGAYAEAEATFHRITADRPDDPRGFVGLAQTAQRRQAWAAAVERWDVCIARFPEPQVGWLRTRANALERLQRWREAYQAWETLASRPEAEMAAVIGRARCFVQWAGPTDEAEQMLGELVERFPTDVTVCILHASIAAQRQEPHTALSRYLKCCALAPGDLRALQGAMEMAVRASDAEAARRILDFAPDAIRDTAAYRSAVLLRYFRLTTDTAAGLALIEALSDDELDAVGARSVAQFLASAIEYRKLLAFCRRMQQRFPLDLQLLRWLLFTIYHTEGDAAFEAEKARCLRLLGEPEAIQLLRFLEPSWLSAGEVIRIIDQEFDDAAERDIDLGLVTRIGTRSDQATLDHLARRLETHGRPGGYPSLVAVLARVHDVRRLGTANLGRLSWADLARSSEATARRLDGLLAEAAASAASNALQRPAAALRTVLRAHPQSRVNSGESYYDAAEVARWLVDRIERREPTSLIRLGDGEGMFLPYDPMEAEFRGPDRRWIQQIWWGKAPIVGEAGDRISDMLVACVAEADALGVPPPRRLFEDIVGETRGRAQRGISNVLDHIAAAPARLDRRLLTSCHIHTDLHRWDLYRQVFAALSDVSVISCHDLGRTLADRFGLPVRQWFPIPPEHAFSGLFGAAADPAVEPFFPVVFERLLAEIKADPGEVFLVAAGFLGKLLCNRIRQLGGVAIDLGSAADLWMDHVTRRGSLDQIDLDISACLVEGQPFDDRFDASAVFGEGPCRSDRTRRRNLIPQFEPLFIEDMASADRRYRLRVIGHPRCGSAYTAQAMQALGLEIGHERPLRDGICSWIHAVDDLNPPFQAPPIAPEAFETTLAYVRDPADAVPSIMLEDCQGASFSFRRFHLARRLRIDVARRRTALARAVESYLGWMEIIDRQQPLCTLRVERLATDLLVHEDALAQAGVRLDPRGLAAVEALPTDLNPSSRKVVQDKPVIAPAEYGRLPADLLDRLAVFCDRHAYRRPWDAPA